MANKIESIKISELKKIGVFKTAKAVELGISQPTLSRLASSGSITRLEHGFFVHSESEIDPADIDYALACAKFEISVQGLQQALFDENVSN